MVDKHTDLRSLKEASSIISMPPQVGKNNLPGLNLADALLSLKNTEDEGLHGVSNGVPASTDHREIIFNGDASQNVAKSGISSSNHVIVETEEATNAPGSEGSVSSAFNILPQTTLRSSTSNAVLSSLLQLLSAAEATSPRRFNQSRMVADEHVQPSGGTAPKIGDVKGNREQSTDVADNDGTVHTELIIAAQRKLSDLEGSSVSTEPDMFAVAAAVADATGVYYEDLNHLLMNGEQHKDIDRSPDSLATLYEAMSGSGHKNSSSSNSSNRSSSSTVATSKKNDISSSKTTKVVKEDGGNAALKPPTKVLAEGLNSKQERPPRRNRGPYKCGRCGMPKTNHTCTTGVIWEFVVDGDLDLDDNLVKRKERNSDGGVSRAPVDSGTKLGSSRSSINGGITSGMSSGSVTSEMAGRVSIETSFRQTSRPSGKMPGMINASARTISESSSESSAALEPTMLGRRDETSFESGPGEIGSYSRSAGAGHPTASSDSFAHASMARSERRERSERSDSFDTSSQEPINPTEAGFDNFDDMQQESCDSDHHHQQQQQQQKNRDPITAYERFLQSVRDDSAEKGRRNRRGNRRRVKTVHSVGVQSEAVALPSWVLSLQRTDDATSGSTEGLQRNKQQEGDFIDAKGNMFTLEQLLPGKGKVLTVRRSKTNS